MSKKTAFAPASVANVIVGFDLLGFALPHWGDQVTVHINQDRAIRVTDIRVRDGISKEIIQQLPKEAENNTATAGLLKLQKDLNLSFGFSVEIEKGIPLGSGLGGSAASAVAAVVAANALLEHPLSRVELLPFALAGEYVASGSLHGDNVAPCLFGGLTLSSNSAYDSLQLPIPQGLSAAVVYPGFRLDTRVSRSVLPQHISLKNHILANSRLATFIAGCFNGDIARIRHNLQDDVIEPARAHLIPGFASIQIAAKAAGAWGASIAGAGPSMFAWCDDSDAPAVLESMLAASKAAGHENSRGWQGKINSDGAHII